MPLRQIFTSILLWLVCCLASVALIYLTVSEREVLGWPGVIAAWGFAVCALLGVPVMVGMNTSGRWYSFGALQPGVEVGPGTMRWRRTCKNVWPLLLILLSLGSCASIIALSGVLEDTPGGALMPFYGVIGLVCVIPLLLMSAVYDTVFELRGRELTMRSNELPFLQRTRRITDVSDVSFQEITGPVPSGCRLYLLGDATTAWIWRGQPIRQAHGRSLQVVVPYFRDTTPEQFEAMVHAHFNALSEVPAAPPTQHPTLQ